MSRSKNEQKQLPIAGYEARCEKIIKDLKGMAGSKFLENEDIFSVAPDYFKRIPHPVAFSTVLERIQGKKQIKYIYLNEFALDLRRIFGNFVRFNYFATAADVRRRRDVTRVLFKFEQLWYDFNNEIKHLLVDKYVTQPLPELKLCLIAFDETVKLPSSGPNVAYTIDNFIDPIKLYMSEAVYQNYTSIVKNPISMGEIISKMVECEYEGLNDLKEDLDLIVGNCSNFWSTEENAGEDGKIVIKDALNLQQTFLKALHNAKTNAKPGPTTFLPRLSFENVPAAPISSSSIKIKKTTSNNNSNEGIGLKLKIPKTTSQTSKTPKNSNKTSLSRSNTENDLNMETSVDVGLEVGSTLDDSKPILSASAASAMERKAEKLLKTTFLMCIEGVKSHYIVGGTNGVKVFTASPFLKAVDPIAYPDYATIVTSPMDLGKIEKNIKNDKYKGGTNLNNIEQFSGVGLILQDMKKIQENAHLYNTGINGLEVRIMADAILHYFEYLLRETLRTLHIHGETNLAKAVFFGSERPSAAELLVQEPKKGKGENLVVSSEPYLVADVKKYISASNETAQVLMDRYGLFKLMGLSSNPVGLSVETRDVAENPPTLSIKRQKSLPKTPTASEVQMVSKEKGKKDFKNKGKGVNNTYDDDFNADNALAGYEDENQGYAETYVGYDGEILDSAGLNTYNPGVLERSAWENEADQILKLISKHPYVDPFKPQTVIADFFVPVILVNPNIAEEYLKIIKNPMDLNTLRENLDSHLILDQEEFYQHLVSIFQNAVTYNEPHQDSEYICSLVERCKHLVKYSEWLCFENFQEIPDDTDLEPEEAEKKFGTLRKSNQEKARKERENLLNNWLILETGQSPYTESKKLLKDLDRCKNNQERIQLSYFVQPVNEDILSDYSVYVRKPVDLSTIKFRLDGSLPGNAVILNAINKTLPRYTTYGELINDLRRVFSNAVKYNRAHLETDNSGLSKNIYEAALFLKDKLEGLLNSYTLNLADRIERARITKNETFKRDQKRKIQLEQEESAARKFEEKIFAQLKANDEIFAADYDVKLKQLQTEKELKQQLLEQQKLLIAAKSGNLASESSKIEELVEEMPTPEHAVEHSSHFKKNVKPSEKAESKISPEALSSASASAAAKIIGNIVPTALVSNDKNPSALLCFGFGSEGKVPEKFVSFIAQKKQVRERAWMASWQPTFKPRLKPTENPQKLDGPVLTDQKGDGPVLKEQKADGPVLKEQKGDGPVLKEQKGDGPVLKEQKRDDPVLKEQNGPADSTSEIIELGLKESGEKSKNQEMISLVEESLYPSVLEKRKISLSFSNGKNKKTKIKPKMELSYFVSDDDV